MSKRADGRIRASDMEAMLEGRDGRAGWWWRMPIGGVGRREPVVCLRLMTKLVETTKLPEAEQREAEGKFEIEVRALGRDAPYTRMLVPAASKVAQACRRKTALVRCLMVLVAVERYRLEQGHWPESLAPLKPKLLKRLPTDPYAGNPIPSSKFPHSV